MDTPNPPPAAAVPVGLPQVCSPAAPSGSAVPGGSVDDPSGAAPERPDAGAATTARLRAGLASRLRSAYEQGAGLDDLAVASHQSISEVRELLALADDPAEEGAVPAQRDGSADLHVEPASVDDWRPTAGRPRPRVRRQLPSRRPVRPAVPEFPAGAEPPRPGTRARPAAEPAALAAAVEQPAPDGVDGEPARSEPPLGVLIGGSRPSAPLGGRRAEDCRRRVAAELVKVGRGTTLVVLPAWRASIAVSVPTELLAGETGLSVEELAGTELTVVVNTEALHDRELRPAQWQVVAERPGGGRRRD
ncbi:hypothetical protein ACFYNO_32545 [Kitasatospora sp. NPDC006697]|uniref:hypothetical protein n=1 Tax=Kitasatospora sp. NPDC006697 TaxID=3364020 RepID=UPI0036C0F213